MNSADRSAGWGDSPRGKRGKRKLPDVQRDAQAAELRAAGWSYRQIADRFGVAHTTAARMEQRALDRVVLPSVLELRAVENSAIAADMAALGEIIADPPPVVAPNGAVSSVRNMTVVVQAVDARTRLRARYARLNGLDAPSVTVHANYDDKIADAIGMVRQIAVLAGKVEPASVDMPLTPEL